MYHGINIIESPHCTIDDEVKRTWWERLFTKPWRPFLKMKTVKKKAMFNYDNTIICHPDIAKQLRDTIQNKKAPA